MGGDFGCTVALVAIDASQSKISAAFVFAKEVNTVAYRERRNHHRTLPSINMYSLLIGRGIILVPVSYLLIFSIVIYTANTKILYAEQRWISIIFGSYCWVNTKRQL